MFRVRQPFKPRAPKDTLHCIHQGLGPIAIASLVAHHFEETGVTLGQLDKCWQDAFEHYKKWCKTKQNLVAVTSSRFTALRFGRENFQTYPTLASCYKGAMVKGLIYWVAEFLLECFRTNPTPSSRLRACCAFALAQFQFQQDSNGPWLSQDVANDVAYMGRTFLLLYQKLACEARLAFPQRRVYKVIPKFHSFLHMCLCVTSVRRNARFEHLYQEEDFMKHISKICSVTHPTTMDHVCLSRYRALKELCED